MAEQQAAITGSDGLSMFNDTVRRMEGVKRVFSKRQKLQFAALKRAALRHDWMADWSALIERAFAIWEEANHSGGSAEKVTT